MPNIIGLGENDHGFPGQPSSLSGTTGKEGPPDAKGSALVLRLLAGLCFASWLVMLEWKRGKALSSGLFAIVNGMPYLFVLLHRKRWFAQAVGVAFGFSITGAVLALFLEMFTWASDPPSFLTGIIFMNVALLATSIVAWVSERGQLRAIVVILYALCALFYIPFLFIGFSGH